MSCARVLQEYKDPFRSDRPPSRAMAYQGAGDSAGFHQHMLQHWHFADHQEEGFPCDRSYAHKDPEGFHSDGELAAPHAESGPPSHAPPLGMASTRELQNVAAPGYLSLALTRTQGPEMCATLSPLSPTPLSPSPLSPGPTLSPRIQANHFSATMGKLQFQMEAESGSKQKVPSKQAPTPLFGDKKPAAQSLASQVLRPAAQSHSLAMRHGSGSSTTGRWTEGAIPLHIFEGERTEQRPAAANRRFRTGVANSHLEEDFAFPASFPDCMDGPLMGPDLYDLVDFEELASREASSRNKMVGQLQSEDATPMPAVAGSSGKTHTGDVRSSDIRRISAHRRNHSSAALEGASIGPMDGGGRSLSSGTGFPHLGHSDGVQSTSIMALPSSHDQLRETKDKDRRPNGEGHCMGARRDLLALTREIVAEGRPNPRAMYPKPASTPPSSHVEELANTTTVMAESTRERGQVARSSIVVPLGFAVEAEPRNSTHPRSTPAAPFHGATLHGNSAPALMHSAAQLGCNRSPPNSSSAIPLSGNSIDLLAPKGDDTTGILNNSNEDPRESGATNSALNSKDAAEQLGSCSPGIPLGNCVSRESRRRNRIPRSDSAIPLSAPSSQDGYGSLKEAEFRRRNEDDRKAGRGPSRRQQSLSPFQTDLDGAFQDASVELKDVALQQLQQHFLTQQQGKVAHQQQDGQRQNGRKQEVRVNQRRERQQQQQQHRRVISVDASTLSPPGPRGGNMGTGGEVRGLAVVTKSPVKKPFVASSSLPGKRGKRREAKSGEWGVESNQLLFMQHFDDVPIEYLQQRLWERLQHEKSSLMEGAVAQRECGPKPSSGSAPVWQGIGTMDNSRSTREAVPESQNRTRDTTGHACNRLTHPSGTKNNLNSAVNAPQNGPSKSRGHRRVGSRGAFEGREAPFHGHGFYVSTPLSFSDYVLRKPYEDIRAVYSLGKSVLGEGQFGVIRSCIKRRSSGGKGGREVLACKTISKEQILSKEDAGNVRSEVSRMACLMGHPNVIEVKETFEDEKDVHFVMELCQGGDLFDRIKSLSSYGERDAALLIHSLLAALSHCHSHGIIHRDVKPENVLLCDQDDNTRIKLIDFGVATTFTRGIPLSEVSGTPEYMAPEVVLGSYGPEADVWSAGVVLYIMLSGVPPFWTSSSQSVADAILTKSVSFRNAKWSGVSQEAKHLIGSMLEKDPQRRIHASEILGHPWIMRWKSNNASN